MLLGRFHYRSRCSKGAGWGRSNTLTLHSRTSSIHQNNRIITPLKSNKYRNIYKCLFIYTRMAINFEDLERQIKERGRLTTLDNGVVVTSENVPGSGLLKGGFTVQAGHGYEAHHGAAHFLEHMCFNGSRSTPSQEAYEEQANTIGLLTNASTGVFDIGFPIQGANQSGFLLHHYFPEALRLVTDIAFFPTLTEASLRKELPIIQQELKDKVQREANDPTRELYAVMMARVQRNNPFFEKNGLGTVESLNTMTREQLRAHHKKFFIGPHVRFALIGDLNGNDSQASRTIEARLLEIPAGTRVAPLEVRAEEPYKGRERLELQSPNKGKSQISINFHIPPAHHVDAYQFNVLAYVLANSTNSLLYRELREQRGLVYSVRANLSGHARTGFFEISYSVDPDKVDESLAVVDAAIERVRAGDFDEAYIRAFELANLPQLLYNFQNPGWIQAELFERVSKERFGVQSTHLERLQRALTQGKREAVHAANQYLGEDRLEIITTKN